MKIEGIKVLWGSNYWSINKHYLIVMLLNLEELEFLPSNKIPRVLGGFEKPDAKSAPASMQRRRAATSACWW